MRTLLLLGYDYQTVILCPFCRKFQAEWDIEINENTGANCYWNCECGVHMICPHGLQSEEYGLYDIRRGDIRPGTCVEELSHKEATEIFSVKGLPRWFYPENFHKTGAQKYRYFSVGVMKTTSANCAGKEVKVPTLAYFPRKLAEELNVENPIYYSAYCTECLTTCESWITTESKY